MHHRVAEDETADGSVEVGLGAAAAPGVRRLNGLGNEDAAGGLAGGDDGGVVGDEEHRRGVVQRDADEPDGTDDRRESDRSGRSRRGRRPSRRGRGSSRRCPSGSRPSRGPCRPGRGTVPSPDRARGPPCGGSRGSARSLGGVRGGGGTRRASAVDLAADGPGPPRPDRRRRSGRCQPPPLGPEHQRGNDRRRCRDDAPLEQALVTPAPAKANCRCWDGLAMRCRNLALRDLAMRRVERRRLLQQPTELVDREAGTRTIVPIVIALTGLCRGMVTIRVPSVITRGLPWRPLASCRAEHGRPVERVPEPYPLVVADLQSVTALQTVGIIPPRPKPAATGVTGCVPALEMIPVTPARLPVNPAGADAAGRLLGLGARAGSSRRGPRAGPFLASPFDAGAGGKR